MTSIVIYSSHRGNTQKIAEAIAEAANCKTVKLTKNFEPINLDGVDLVFFGTGIRGGEPYVELLNYINKANFDCGKRFALFMTWAGGGASNKLAYEGVKKALETKEVQLNPDYFICLGKTFGITHRDRPNQGDLTQAKKWANQQQINNPWLSSLTG